MITSSRQSTCGRPPAVISSDQLCCDQKIHPRYVNGMKQDCCMIQELGSNATRWVVYNKLTAICCGGTLMNITEDLNGLLPECCGSEILKDPNNGFCCNGLVYDVSDKHNFCCGDALPAGDDDLCCSEDGKPPKVYSKRGRRNLECCGSEWYIFDENICYENRLWPLDSIPASCGDSGILYDKKNQVCCEETGTLLNRKDYTNMNQYVHTEPNLSCFNGRFVDLDQYQIVKDYTGTKVLIPRSFKLCGKDTFDPNSERTEALCCDGKLYHTPKNSNTMCCGTKLYNSTSNVCCNGQVLTDDQQCCGQRYIYSRYQSELDCCGSEVINRTEFLCCKHQSSYSSPVSKTRTVDDKCCGNNTYNSNEDKFCCNNTIHYRVTDKICHHNRVMTLSDLQNMAQSQPAAPSVSEDDSTAVQIRSKPDCPVCLDLHNFEPCVKKFKYQFVVNKVYKNRKSTIIRAVLKPWSIVNLKISQPCNCFRKGQIYSLFTNRNYVQRISKGFTLRFDGKDILAKLVMDNQRVSLSKNCIVNRWQKKSSPRL